MGKGTQNKRTYGTPWVHQKEARANEINELGKGKTILVGEDLETALQFQGPGCIKKKAKANEIDELRKAEAALTSADYSFLETASKLPQKD